MERHYCVKVIGKLVDLSEDQLPTKGDILRALYYRMHVLKMAELDSIQQTVQKCIKIWTDGQIPLMSESECYRKFYLLYGEWELLELQSRMKSQEEYILVEQTFLDSLDEVFDIGDIEFMKLFNSGKCGGFQPIEVKLDITEMSCKPIKFNDTSSEIIKVENDYVKVKVKPY